MSLLTQKQRIKLEINELERILALVGDHTIMKTNLGGRISMLKEQLSSTPEEPKEVSLKLLFSGKAVKGSRGIRSDFLSKTLPPLQAMIKTQFSVSRFKQKEKPLPKSKTNASYDLFITALPVGSFGVELKLLNEKDLFDNEDLERALNDTMNIIQEASISDERFEGALEKVPKNNIEKLKSFLKPIADEDSFLEMLSGESKIELPVDKVKETFVRVSSTKYEEDEKIMQGIFRGLLLDSGKFEAVDEKGNRIAGFVHEDLPEDQLIKYDTEFLNKECVLHLKLHRTWFKSGKERIEFELLELRNKL